MTENNPSDNIDCWESNDASAGDYLELYLDGNSYGNYVTAEMYDGDSDLMQRLQRTYPNGNNNAAYDYTLDRSPVDVRITGNLEDQTYTFCIYVN